MKIKVFIISAAIIFFLINGAVGQEIMNWEGLDNCTSVLVTKSASVDGSVMTTHSCDGNYEFRIHVIPAKRHPQGTMRPVYKGGGRGREQRQARIAV